MDAFPLPTARIARVELKDVARQFSPCSRELLLSFRFSVKDSEPLSAVLNPYTRGVICTRYVLPLRGRLRCDLVCYDSDVSARVRYFRIRERVVPQIGLCHVRDFCGHGLDPVAPFGVGAAVILGQILLKGVSLFTLVCFPNCLFRVYHRRVVRSRFGRLRWTRLTEAKRHGGEQRHAEENELFFHRLPIFDFSPSVCRDLLIQLLGAADAEATTKKASGANRARFTGLLLNRLSVREKDFSTGDYSRSLTFSFRANEILGNRRRSAQIDSAGRVLFTADAHRDDGKRFIITADKKLTAFLELKRVTHESFRFLNAE